MLVVVAAVAKYRHDLVGEEEGAEEHDFREPERDFGHETAALELVLMSPMIEFRLHTFRCLFQFDEQAHVHTN